MGRMETDTTHQAAIVRLTQLRTDGRRIRNDGALVDDSNIGEWLKRVVRWMIQVSRVIQNIDEADSQYFKTADAVPQPQVFKNCNCQARANQADYLTFYSQHNLRLIRLDELLKKYGISL